MREHVSRQAVAISEALRSRGLRVALEIEQGVWNTEDFSLYDSYFTDCWPERYPIQIRVSTDGPARLSQLSVKLLWASSGGVFWLIGDPPEPPAINVRNPVESVVGLTVGEMGLHR